MAVPYTFAGATSSIPLSQLDANFATAFTLGNTAIQLGNTVTTLNNMTLANVTISSGNVTITNVSVTTANVTTGNVTTLTSTNATLTNMSSGNVTITGGTINGTTLGATTAASANVTTLTTSSTVTLNGGTANGVAYLNGSKVLTTGSALTFDGTNFASTGIITSTNANGLRAQYPSSASYYAQLDSRDGNTYLSAVGSTAAIVFRATDGPGTTAEAMRLTSTGLGIGTSSPATRLHVSSSSQGVARFQSTDAEVNIELNNSSASGNLFGTAGANFYWYSGATERMRLDSSGNLGIEVTPSAWSAAAKALQITNYGAALSSFGGGATWSSLTHNAWFDGTNWKYTASSVGAALYQTTGSNAGSTHSWSVAAGGTAGNTISFTQALTLTAAGDLGVGTTSPGGGSRLHVDASGGGIIRVTRLASSATAYGQLENDGTNTTLTSSAALLFNAGGSTERARIPSAGGFVVGTAALATNATTGFLYVPTCAGTPTGTPATQTGTAPIVVDTTNNKLYFYSGGQWRDAGP